MFWILRLVVVVVCAMVVSSATAAPNVDQLAVSGSIDELRAAMARGDVTAVQLTRFYLQRIRDLDATLHSVIATDPRALEEAAERDAERARGVVRGALHGIPILIKDNIETKGALATTAGSLALKDNVNDRDAAVVARLRAAGAVILGKTNLSEWANIRSSASSSGWSAIGGQTKNPHALDRSPCGSSSGSAVATSAGLAAATVGTETDGSITCPAAVNGIVGIKPTVGLVSRTHIIPISASQDTAGPMTRTVRDTALLLTAMAGSDSADPKSRDADVHKRDYAASLDTKALSGARIGVLRATTGKHRATDAVFERALTTLRQAGALLVDIDTRPNQAALWEAEQVILETELKAGLNAYLASVTPAVPTRSLADVIAFNVRTPAELRYFGQELFESAEKRGGLGTSEYRKAVAEARRASRTLDQMFAKGVVALVAPTTGPAWVIDLVNGDHFVFEGSAGAAVAGYPHLTVPMGEVDGLPVGLSFIGRAWSEATLLSLGYAYEQLADARRAPTFLDHVAP